MTRAAVLLFALLVLAPAASAEPIGIYHDREAASVALAGPDVIVFSEPSIRRDDVNVVAVPRTGGRARALLHVEHALLGGGVAASRQRVAAIVDLEDETRLYSGPPSGPLTVVRRAEGRYEGKAFVPSSIDVDGDRLLLVESVLTISFGDEETASPVRASIFDGSTWTPIPWANGKRRPFQIAGPYASVLASDPRRVEVVEIATGAVVTTVDAGEYAGPSDLGADGQVIVSSLKGIDVAGPNLAPYHLPNSGRLGGGWFAANTFVALDDAHSTLNLFGPDSSQTALGPPSRGENKSVEADADGVAWLFNGCVRYAPLSAPAAPTAKDACPTTEVSLYLIGPRTKLRGDHARVAVMCVNGPGGRCRGKLHVRFSRRSPVVARGTFDLPVSDRWQYAKVHFTPAALAKMRRQGYGDALVHAVIPNGTVSSLAPYESEFTVDV